MNTEVTLSPALRQRGHRLTRARQLVWEVLRTADAHLTVEEIAEQVNRIDGGINLASVYRALTLFAELNLVREAHLGVDKASRWELAHPDEYIHLVCAECGSVTHHDDDMVPQIRVHLQDNHGFRADTVDVVVTGRCQACAQD